MLGQVYRGGMSEEQGARYENLLYRRQFILGPSFLDNYPTWQQIKIREHFVLSVHPELNVQQISRNNITITLLGYILDPYEPSATDLDVLQRLLDDFLRNDTFEGFLKSTFSMSGRWILLVDDGASLRLFNDATGCRQVFYTESSNGELMWCASQPNLIAEKIPLDFDPEAVCFFKSSEEKGLEYTFPGDTSLYKGVRHLLPNHYLDLTSAEVCRYWPNENLREISLEDCVLKVSRILKGSMQSAFNRFPLGLSVTAGRDTRLALASTESLKDKLWCFTLMYWGLNEQSPDLEIPTRLCRKLGITHQTIRCPQDVDEDFLSVFRNNVSGAHQIYSGIAQGLYEHYPQERAYIKGAAIPVAKWHYQGKLPSWKRGRVTPHLLSELNYSKGDLFAIKNFDQWLNGAADHYNIDILDLFEWEIREGNWQAMAQLEFDIAHEIFVPFNCRELLTTMLSLDAKYRKPPKYILHSELISILWPEMLAEPINPPVGIKSNVKVLLPQSVYLPLKSFKEFVGSLRS